MSETTRIIEKFTFCSTKTRFALESHLEQGSGKKEENPEHCSTTVHTPASEKSKLCNALTLLVNSKIIQRCSVNVHTGKCTSGEGHVMGRPKNENFSAATINTEGHNLNN